MIATMQEDLVPSRAESNILIWCRAFFVDPASSNRYKSLKQVSSAKAAWNQWQLS